MQQEIALTEARAKLGELVDLVRFRDETIVLVKSGKPAAALIPVEWLERYQRERAAAFQVVDAVRARNADAAASEEELQQIVALAIRAVRDQD
ncbi:MAG: type II toxin-antitoxin system Phd/YefM family antitoxin [Caldilineaceae bacterium]|nr:type II toxin-antitoxin system Phd/YefM family antitoxin [Caldilinea sp.]MCB0055342.1 type II toxin-antitoxin system Phd/YefM family antitoxin [Caldilinea sp.]MCB0066194.1 type II toxin-antitoxin system Phd/YefM family antitoxin [Caldilineaceae bacterium]MCB0137571.1 type II toxin-antitoxin system Phd/YefM family antitoxin [Caldilineaceae bacterium]MCB0152000.1 type II toxin-antitoxin system Phd/YefM family antitoxin [Caldilineaceae bacterium]